MLVELLQNQVPQLDEKCSFKGCQHDTEFGPASLSYQTFRAAIFESLGELGASAKEAIPVLNEFLNPNPTARSENIKLNMADHEAQVKALQTLSEIGLNADSIHAIERYLNWPSLRMVKPDPGSSGQAHSPQ